MEIRFLLGNCTSQNQSTSHFIVTKRGHMNQITAKNMHKVELCKAPNIISNSHYSKFINNQIPDLFKSYLIWCSFMCGSHRSLVDEDRLSLQHNHIKRALCYFSLHTGRRITYLPLTPTCLLYLFPQCLFKEISYSGARIQRGAWLTVMYKFLFYVQAVWQKKMLYELPPYDPPDGQPIAHWQ